MSHSTRSLGSPSAPLSERLAFSFQSTVPARPAPAPTATFPTLAHSEPRDWGYTGLLAFTAVLLLRPQEQFPVLAPFRLAEVCALLGILPMLVHRLTHRLPAFRVTAETLALAVFAAVIIATVPFSIWPGGAMSVFLDVIVKVMIVFILMMNTLTTPRRIEQITWLFLASVGFIAGRAVFDYVRGVNLVEGNRLAGPVGGIFGNPNDLALNMVAVLPLAIMFALSTRTSTLKRLFAAGLVALLTATVIFTKSRSGVMGLVVMMATMVLLTRTIRPMFGVAVIAAALATTPFLPSTFVSRMTSIFDESQDAREFTGSREARTTVMREGLMVFAERPLTGVGAGQFKNYNFEGRQERWRESHNVLIQVAAETGIVGLLAFVFLIFRGITTALWLRRTLGPRRARSDVPPAVQVLTPDERATLHGHGIAMSGALIGWFACAMFASVAYGWTFYYLLALTIAARELILDRVRAAGLAVQSASGRRRSRVRGTVGGAVHA